MALKGDRYEADTDITSTCESVAEAGVILCFKTAGSGVAMGGSRNLCDLYASPSGKVPSGLLLNDVVNVDETQNHRNFHKDTMQIAEPSRQLRKGWVITNKVSGTPTVGATAYLTANGEVTPTLSTTGGLAATPKVGQFASIKDESGYVKLEVNLPVV